LELKREVKYNDRLRDLTMSQNLRLFFSTLVLYWGFAIRYKGTSASQPAYILPPPTTIIGAYAQAILRILGTSDKIEIKKRGEGRVLSRLMNAFIESTKTASAGVIGSIGLSYHQEISRIVASMYKGGGEISRMYRVPFSAEFYKDAIPRIFPVQAVGVVYSPGAKLRLLWIFDLDVLLHELSRNGTRLSKEEFDDIAEIAKFNITRIGSKEGIAALEESNYVTEVKIIEKDKTVRSLLYMPIEYVEPIDTTFFHEVVLTDLNYRLRSFYVPAFLASNNVLMPLPNDKLLPMVKLKRTAYTFDDGIAKGIIGVEI